jgi:hypothetical protein
MPELPPTAGAATIAAEINEHDRRLDAIEARLADLFDIPFQADPEAPAGRQKRRRRGGDPA